MSDHSDALTLNLKQFSEAGGADLFGVADLVPAENFIRSQGPPWIERFPRAISIGMRLNDLIVDQHTPLEPRRNSLYWYHVYSIVTPSLDFLAYNVSRRLNRLGYQAFPVPGSTPYNFENLSGILSHKLAAHLAGLGWIGKSCMLITPQFGPRVRFVSILTDAPLDTGTPVDGLCGQCRVCMKACPVEAFTGREFSPEEERDARFDAFRCSEYRREHPCGLCVSSCPKGKSGAQPSFFRP
jgi:epoxyqueuosine reductase QueG